MYQSLRKGKLGINESPNKELPLFMGHGDADGMVKPEWAVSSRDELVKWGWNVDLKLYP